MPSSMYGFATAPVASRRYARNAVVCTLAESKQQAHSVPGPASASATAPTISLKSLGCPKNTTDAEVILGDLAASGYRVVPEGAESDIVVVNTCGFVEDAKRESVNAILDTARSGARVVVTGCMAQRHGDELKDLLPEVDDVVGFAHYADIPALLNRTGDPASAALVGDATVPFRDETKRVRLGAAHSAYVRVGEGCDQACTFCAIPGFRGRLRSKPYDSIVEECRALAKAGAQELVLIAEDTNQYGIDFGNSDHRRLEHLLQDISPMVPWVRLLYCYPSAFSQELIQAIADLPTVCKYVDMPLQHASGPVLRAMRRPSRAHTEAILKRLRDGIPGLAIRTTFISGFPGETEEDHKELVRFVRENRFRRAGFFIYSKEEGTPAAELPNQIPYDVAEARRDELVELQQSIQEEDGEAMVGQIIEVLVDKNENGECIGRTAWDALDIDGIVHVLQEHQPGTMLKCRVLGTSALDLYAETVQVVREPRIVNHQDLMAAAV